MTMSREELKRVACEAVEAAADDLNILSQHIWGQPEEAFQEHYAHKLLTDFLERHQFSVSRHYVLETGFRAVYGGGSGPNIAVLCEYDSLPEIGHACGHNLIAEAGVGAALGIQAAMNGASQHGPPLGKLTILGTPAEEVGGGKIDFIRADAFRDVDIAMMVHPFISTALSGSLLTERQEVKVEYHGKESHAAAFPWEGVNALDAAVMAYTSISVMRQQAKPSWRIHGIITKGGTKPNIIPNETQMHYFVRSSTAADSKILKTKLNACFHAAAEATGCTVDILWDPKPYANMRSDPTLVQLYQANGVSLGETFDTSDSLIAGSSDMGNVSQVIPGIHPFYNIGSNVLNHTRAFTEAAGAAGAQTNTLRHAKIMALTAIDIYCQPGLVSKMKAEFDGASVQ